MFPTESGIKPVNWLPDKTRLLILVREVSQGGMAPDRLLFPKSTLTRLPALPIQEGIVPDSWLSLRSKVFNRGAWVTLQAESKPVNLFPLKSSLSKRGNEGRLGRGPLNWLSLTFTSVR